MDNKTVVFNPLEEINQLKRVISSLELRVEDLERGQQNMFPTFGPVPGHPKYTPIFGPRNLDWWKVTSTSSELKSYFTQGKEENE